METRKRGRTPKLKRIVSAEEFEYRAETKTRDCLKKYPKMTQRIFSDMIRRIQEKIEKTVENFKLTLENYRPLIQIITDGEDVTWESITCNNCRKPAVLHGDNTVCKDTIR